MIKKSAFKLTKEEQEIEEAFMRGEYKPITGKLLKEIEDSLKARKKDKVMTIRVNNADIERIKKKAKKLGVKYQTYISELIHTVAML